MPVNQIVYVAGEFRPAAAAVVSVFDHGLLYGDGIFEGIRAYNGRVFRLERHLERLYDSAKAIRLDMPGTPDELAAVVVETCRRNAIADGYIRLLVTRGPGDLSIDPHSCTRPQIIVIVLSMAGRLRTERDPIRVVTSAFRRNAPDAVSPAIKSLNYLNSVLARIEANDRGADEALLLDHQGFVSEGTAENIFIATAHGLVTPPVTDALDGITRATICELAGDLGIAVEERPIALFDVWKAREAFLCGTMAEIVPIGSVDGRVVGSGGVGPMTARLMAAYHQLVRSVGTPIGEAVEAQVSI